MMLMKKLLKDRNGNLKDELDLVRARYAFPPFMPTDTSNNYIEVPNGYIFYMVGIEVINEDSSNAHTFHIENPSGNVVSIEYSIPAGETKTIDYWDKGMTEKIYFVPNTYGKLQFRPYGYLEKV